MRIVRGIANLPPLPMGCVATIGTFDGVHLGHQRLIGDLAEQGRRMGLPVAVALFEPQPREFFQPEQAPARLYRLREKIGALARTPVDLVLLLRFDQSLADLPAEDFIRRVLVEGLHVKYLVVGDDFRFGRARRGDFAMLCRAGEAAGFQEALGVPLRGGFQEALGIPLRGGFQEALGVPLRGGFAVADTPTFAIDGRRVSSTWVREALEAGDCTTAARLLGRPYAVCGRVVHGNKQGRILGYPTANLALRRKTVPVRGVFAVTMSVDGRDWAGVANVGVRPTLDGSSTVLLETHLFDFCQDIYQRLVEVRFHAKLRDELRFASVDALRAQIQKDAEAARTLLAATNLPL